MSKGYKSEVSAASYETAQGLYEHGIIDKKSLCEFDVPSALDEIEMIPQATTDEETTRQPETD